MMTKFSFLRIHLWDNDSSGILWVLFWRHGDFWSRFWRRHLKARRDVFDWAWMDGQLRGWKVFVNGRCWRPLCIVSSVLVRSVSHSTRVCRLDKSELFIKWNYPIFKFFKNLSRPFIPSRHYFKAKWTINFDSFPGIVHRRCGTTKRRDFGQFDPKCPQKVHERIH